ncbi:uncharacterized protein I303_100535 [Kwoniella dejecticola CBS 10117]|uniref:BSD domain-containing protein n=1 Tax=Kwoniella dejecticola CBS 10117 TaxID=1296121 RepID=A0A1A6AF92_9TREE|nr:uncharacterized protein I303_00536 [Kwoniella dejecticola CBS 10117]OBR88719.1 hypothetical protein I303_00536 [Kwoniella dejecticola CBS 10117]
MSTSSTAQDAGSPSTSTTASAVEPTASTTPPRPASPAETIHAPTSTSTVASETPAAAQSSNAASTRTVQQALQQSINRNNFEEEVGQVMGTLNSWWGGVKKQSASALTTLKADIDKTVHQAQADLEYLRTANIEVVRKDPAEYAAEQEAEKAKKEAAKAAKEEEEKSKEKGKGKATDQGESSNTENTTSNLLNKLTSSTTQLQHTLQQTLHKTLDAASNNPNLSNPEVLRAKLAENLKISSAKENLQLSIQQAEKLAEEYLKKSEGFLKDAEKWVEDNVKVVPPDSSFDGSDEDKHMVSMGWDGSDFYSFSTSTPTAATSSKEKIPSSDTGDRKTVSTLALAGSRKDALLRRLREDKELLMVDPAGQGETEERKQEFRAWVNEHFESQRKELREVEEGNVGGIRMELVPEHLTDEQFWQRYLFHKHMIEGEEKKRKALMQATTHESETDDFNWDDEPEESPVSAAPQTTLDSVTAQAAEATPKVENDGKMPSSSSTAPAPPKALTSASTSPRDSEESYDVVSDQGNVKKPVVQASTPVNETDEDSDWE